MNETRLPEKKLMPGDTAACIMTIVALVALGISCQWTHAIIIVPLIVAAGVYHAFPFHPFKKPGLIGHLVIALPFATLSRIWEAESRSGFSYNLSFYVGLYVTDLAVIALYTHNEKRRLSKILLCSGLAFGAGCDMHHRLYLGLLTVFALCVLSLMRSDMNVSESTFSGKRKHLLGIGLSFIAVAIISAGIAFPIRAYYNEINNWLLRNLRRMPLASSAGFSSSAKLGTVMDIRSSAANQVAVRAFSDHAPGYLRGKVFVNYGDSMWAALGMEKEFKVDRKERNQKTGRFTIPNRTPAAEGAQANMRIYPTSNYKAHFFLPLNTTTINTSSKTVILLAGNALRSSLRPTNRGYKVFTDPTPVFSPRPDDDDEAIRFINDKSAVYLAIPVNPAMREALDNVLTKAGLEKSRLPPREAVTAIADYFNNNYEYRIGISFLPNVDPLWQFLTQKRHGHCELFASAGTMLLRRMGIPARYVTGFVCDEKNPYGNLWIARNRHAHAWVEYLDPDLGWTTAEFTPANGLPETDSLSGFDAVVEYIRALFEKAIGIWLTEGFAGLITAGLEIFAVMGVWLLAEWWRILLVTAAFGAFIYMRLKSWNFKKRKAQATIRTFPDNIQSLRQDFFALQKKLKKAGLAKQDSETLEEYLTRLSAAELEDKESSVALVRKLASLRYSQF